MENEASGGVGGASPPVYTANMYTVFSEGQDKTWSIVADISSAKGRFENMASTFDRRPTGQSEPERSYRLSNVAGSAYCLRRHSERNGFFSSGSRCAIASSGVSANSVAVMRAARPPVKPNSSAKSCGAVTTHWLSSTLGLSESASGPSHSASCTESSGRNQYDEHVMCLGRWYSRR